MPQLASPLSSPDGVPALNQAHLDKAQGFVTQFATLAALNAALALRTPLWDSSAEVRVVAEPVVRIWNGQHCRTVKFPTGESFVLTAATNVVLSPVAFPTGGAAGDMAYNGSVYLNTAGTWALVEEVIVPTSRALLATDFGKVLIPTGTVVFDNSSGIGFRGARGIRIRPAAGATASLTASAGLTNPFSQPLTLVPNATHLLTCDAAGVLTFQG